ncbi:MAG: hypothetical protein J7K48_01545, partial [Thermococcus sp.]|nr:hypothetical protein [Thermococcus sp.]
SEEAVKFIKSALGIDENARAFDIEVRDVLRLPIKELPEKDRKVLLEAAGKLDAESKLHIEYRYRPSFD